VVLVPLVPPDYVDLLAQLAFVEQLVPLDYVDLQVLLALLEVLARKVQPDRVVLQAQVLQDLVDHKVLQAQLVQLVLRV
jgi:hypothetical protein